MNTETEEKELSELANKFWIESGKIIADEKRKLNKRFALKQLGLAAGTLVLGVLLSSGMLIVLSVGIGATYFIFKSR